MKNIKTFLALLLIFALVFTFSACGSGGDNGGSDPAPSDQSEDAGSDTDQDQAAPDQQDQQDQPAEGEESEPAGTDEDEGESEAEDQWDEATGDEGEEAEPSKYEPAAPAPELTGDYTGDFISDTGTALNLLVKWAASENPDGSYNVTTQFFIRCYSLMVSGRQGNTLTVKTSSGEKTYYFNTNEIDKDVNLSEDIFVGETSFDISADDMTSGVEASATWNFRGSYSGTDLPEVTASGFINAN